QARPAGGQADPGGAGSRAAPVPRPGPAGRAPADPAPADPQPGGHSRPGRTPATIAGRRIAGALATGGGGRAGHDRQRRPAGGASAQRRPAPDARAGPAPQGPGAAPPGGGAARTADSGAGTRRRRCPVARSAPAGRRTGLPRPVAAAARGVGVIVGTAGHIDHGKTRLLQALTGQAGDRRREERERGMTIDLGFQYLDLGPDEPVGFIDVPGHERFIPTRLAGAAGIDRVLLVVAADDGVMPQTREHLAIVELLGIPRALVAITKIDRVEPARVAEVSEQVRQLLGPGPLAGAPLFPVSAVSGEGLEALRAALLDEAGACRRQGEEGHFRLAIDRAFSIEGAGTVVTGTAFAGRVSVGDELLLSPAGQRVRVRGLHAQNRAAQQAHAGQRIALNLAGERLSPQRIHRGDWLLDPALHAPTTRLDVQLRSLPEGRPLRHWTPVHVHLGAQDVTGRV